MNSKQAERVMDDVGSEAMVGIGLFPAPGTMDIQCSTLNTPVKAGGAQNVIVERAIEKSDKYVEVRV